MNQDHQPRLDTQSQKILFERRDCSVRIAILNATVYSHYKPICFRVTVPAGFEPAEAQRRQVGRRRVCAGAAAGRVSGSHISRRNLGAQDWDSHKCDKPTKFHSEVG